MTIAKWISLGISVVALLIMLISFIVGTRRGLKRSVIRLFYIAISVLVSGIFAFTICEFVMDLSIPALGGTVRNYLSTMISEMLGDAFKLSGTIAFATLLAELLVASIVFVVLFFVLKFVTLIIYKLTTKRKKLKNDKGEYYTVTNKKGKEVLAREAIKHRWLGGLVGLVQGAAIALIMFMPVSGISNIISKVQSTASASERTVVNENIIDEFVPANIKPYLNVYNDSIFNKAVGWLNVDQGLFNWVTTKKVDNEKISFTDEVLKLNEVYEVTNKFGVSIDNFQNDLFNFSTDKFVSFFDTALDEAFDSLLAKHILTDLSNSAASNFNIMQDLSISDINWDGDREKLTSIIRDNVDIVKKLIVNEGVIIEDIELARFGKSLNTVRELSLVGLDLFEKSMDKAFTQFGVYDYAKEYGVTLNKDVVNFKTTNFENLLGTVDEAIVLADKLSSMGDLSSTEKITNEDIDTLVGILDSDLGESVKEELDTTMKDTIKEELNITLKEETNLVESASTLNDFLKAEDQETLDAKAEEIVDVLKSDEGLVDLLTYNENTFEISDEQYEALEKAIEGDEELQKILDMFKTPGNSGGGVSPAFGANAKEFNVNWIL